MRQLPGYHVYHSQQIAKQKKGEGLAICAKNNIKAYKWYSLRDAWSEDSPAVSEIVWIILLAVARM